MLDAVSHLTFGLAMNCMWRGLYKYCAIFLRLLLNQKIHFVPQHRAQESYIISFELAVQKVVGASHIFYQGCGWHLY